MPFTSQANTSCAGYPILKPTRISITEETTIVFGKTEMGWLE